MSKRIGITILAFFFFVTLWAQQKWNYPEVEKKSYELYIQKDWVGLIEFGKQANKNGIDFFYLQTRIGIAYYNLKLYRKSSDYLMRAWENDHSFEWLQEYLYYSLIYSGRYAEASKVADKFTVAVKQKIRYQKMKPLNIAFETGYSFNPDFDKLNASTYYQDLNIGADYGEAFFLKNYHFESLDYTHQIAPGVGINHNFTYLGISREEQVFWGAVNSFPIKIRQYQYFINPYFVVGKKWYVSPSATIIWGNSDLYLGNYEPNTFYQTKLKYSDFIFTTSTWSHFGNFSPGAEVNFANMYDKGFSQYSAWITWYPLSNACLYFTPRIYFKNDSENGFGYNAFGFSGGVQLGQIHLYSQYLKGDMKNFIEPAGYVVSNFPGRSNRKVMGSIYFPFAKQYQFVIRYINQDIIEKYNVYTGGIISNSMEYKYIKHTLTAGISWIF